MKWITRERISSQPHRNVLANSKVVRVRLPPSAPIISVTYKRSSLSLNADRRKHRHASLLREGEALAPARTDVRWFSTFRPRTH
jgi:hypothetical protein